MTGSYSRTRRSSDLVLWCVFWVEFQLASVVETLPQIYLVARYSNLMTFIAGIRTANALSADVDCQVCSSLSNPFDAFGG